MALIVVIQNVGGADEASRYEAVVYVNKLEIWRGVVGPHNRAEGWPKLLELVAKTAAQPLEGKTESSTEAEGEGVINK